MKDSVKLAQAMLVAGGAKIRSDGVWGPATDQAYVNAPRELRGAIDDALLRWENVRTEDIRRRARNFKQTDTKGGATVVYRRKPYNGMTTNLSGVTVSQTKFISREAAVGLARKYNSLSGIPVGTLEHMLELEAPKVPGGFNPSGIGGAGNRYRGLYQFHDVASNAWADGTRWARTFGVHVPAMYPNGWADAEASTACAAGYAVMNSKLLRDRNIVVTKETLYASHQQGAGAFSKTVKSRTFAYAGAQSGPSVSVLRKAYDQAIA